MKKKSLTNFKPFEDALSRYAEAYHAAHTLPLPDNDEAVDAAFHGLINAIERYIGKRRPRRIVFKFRL